MEEQDGFRAGSQSVGAATGMVVHRSYCGGNGLAAGPGGFGLTQLCGTMHSTISFRLSPASHCRRSYIINDVTAPQ